MNFHLHVRRWVKWWIFVGVVCGAIALVNIVGHHLTPTQDKILLLVGAAHWLLGGLVCWAFESIRVTARRDQSASMVKAGGLEIESHPASDFLLPGGRRSLLPWRH